MQKLPVPVIVGGVVLAGFLGWYAVKRFADANEPDNGKGALANVWTWLTGESKPSQAQENVFSPDEPGVVASNAKVNITNEKFVGKLPAPTGDAILFPYLERLAYAKGYDFPNRENINVFDLAVVPGSVQAKQLAAQWGETGGASGSW